METKSKQTSENFIKEIRRKTRRVFSSEQKIAIVMEALRAETSVAELCRKHSIFEAQFYKWNKEFLEAGKKRLSGDTVREATSDEVEVTNLSFISSLTAIAIELQLFRLLNIMNMEAKIVISS